jgi:hypothetical protein
MLAISFFKALCPKPVSVTATQYFSKTGRERDVRPIADRPGRLVERGFVFRVLW